MILKNKYRKNSIENNKIQYFIEWSKKHKVSYIKLKVSSKNNKAIKFYENERFYNQKLILKKKL